MHDGEDWFGRMSERFAVVSKSTSAIEWTDRCVGRTIRADLSYVQCLLYQWKSSFTRFPVSWTTPRKNTTDRSNVVFRKLLQSIGQMGDVFASEPLFMSSFNQFSHYLREIHNLCSVRFIEKSRLNRSSYRVRLESARANQSWYPSKSCTNVQRGCS